MNRLITTKTNDKSAQKSGLLFVNGKRYSLFSEGKLSIPTRKGVNKLITSSKIFTGVLVSVAALGIAGVSAAHATDTVYPIGWHDGNNNALCRVNGWTLDPTDPTQSNQIHIYRDGPAGSGDILGAFTADQPRQDVNDGTGLPGNHGFSIKLGPETGLYDGNEHIIYVYGESLAGNGVNALLLGSPKPITCPKVEPVVQGGQGGQNQNQDQGQGQNQNQTQNNNQTTDVNVTNTNNNTNNVTITGSVLGEKPEVKKAETPKETPQTGASAAATAVMVGGMPAGFWLRKFGRGALLSA